MDQRRGRVRRKGLFDRVLHRVESLWFRLFVWRRQCWLRCLERSACAAGARSDFGRDRTLLRRTAALTTHGGAKELGLQGAELQALPGEPVCRSPAGDLVRARLRSSDRMSAFHAYVSVAGT